MPTFTILIPLLGPQEQFEQTLASVLRSQPAQTQIIVPFDGKYVDRYNLKAEGVEFVAIPNKRRLVDFWNAGLSRATGELLIVLRPGVEVNDAWSFQVARAFTDRNLGMLAPVVEVGQGRVFGIEVERTGTRRLVTSKPSKTTAPTSYAAVYRNEAIGWLPQIDSGIADVYLDAEIALGLHEVGFGSAIATDWIVTCAGDSIVTEGRLAHGCSAARAQARHSNYLKAAGSAVVSDLISALSAGVWKINHAMERFSAKRFRSVDDRARQLLGQNRKARAELELKRLDSKNGIRRAA
ncbi:MAG: glycosyltransferase family A protein [Pirellulaceae bacterium]